MPLRPPPAPGPADDGPLPPPGDPRDGPAGTRGALFAALRRIDGWGPLAWREVRGAWRLRGLLLALERPEAEAGADDEAEIDVLLAIPHGLGGEEPVATADWVLRLAWDGPFAAAAAAGLAPRGVRPGAAVRASNACFPLPPAAGAPCLCLRVRLLLPMAGMGIAPGPLRRFIAAAERFAARLARPDAGLARHRRAVRVQRALRAALRLHGLCAFLACGARLARDADGAPLPGATPLRVPPGLRRTIDLGGLGRHVGLGIPSGVTALAGAPYHGKTTLLRAILAGAEDHPPGDGRERVVADAACVPVQAEDGRPVKDQDLRAFFRDLPGQDPARFATPRASGATGMAASVLQAVAAGARLLLVDEDTAASNFLALDPGMRRLLGREAEGSATLLECLPALARRGVDAVVVAGSSLAALAYADRTLLLTAWRPRDATRRVRRLVRRAPARPLQVPERHLADHPDALLGRRHFLAVDAGDPARPVAAVGRRRLAADLRRCGWELDEPLARGALQAAAWCCRLAAGGCPLDELRGRWGRFAGERGAPGLDPFHTGFCTLPPWQLVVAALERLELPALACRP